MPRLRINGEPVLATNGSGYLGKQIGKKLLLEGRSNPFEKLKVDKTVTPTKVYLRPKSIEILKWALNVRLCNPNPLRDDIIPEGDTMYYIVKPLARNMRKKENSELLWTDFNLRMFFGGMKSNQQVVKVEIKEEEMEGESSKKTEISDPGISPLSSRIFYSSTGGKTVNMASKTYKIVMVRHGESEWNQKNLFCGWYDANLSPKGIEEAVSAGKALKDAGYKFDLAYTSVLKRAQVTLQSILKEIGQEDLPVEKTWRLNERHYGNLTGLDKAETAAKYGEAQVQIWRRSFDTPPPAMEESNPYYKVIVENESFKEGPPKAEFPMFESLKLTIQRTLPFWNDVIVPQLKSGKFILIAAHGNSLRGIVKHLDQLSDEAIMELNLPTGIPFVYELDENLKPIVSLKFLGDEETVKKAMASVAAQGKAK